MLQKLVVLLTVLQCCTTIESAKRNFKLEFHNYTCLDITQRIRVFECEFLKVGPNRFVFSERLMLDANLGKSFQMRLWIHVKPQNAKKGLRFFDMKFSVCDIFESSFENRLLKGLLNELWRSSNIPLECPFQGNFLYQMNNFSFTDAYFPVYTPFLNFTFTMEFYDGPTLFAITKITGAAAPLK